MVRAHKIRLYPTKEQEIQLLKAVGTSRYVYNWGLAKWKQMWKAVENGTSTQKPSAFLLMKLWTKERPTWSHDTLRSAQDNALKNLEVAFKSFWRGIRRYPRPHKKGRGKDSFYADNGHAYIKNNKFHLPLVGKIKLAQPLRFSGKIIHYTVSTYAGKWYVSVQMQLSEVKSKCLDTTSVVGVDVGLKHVAVSSDGTVLNFPCQLKRLDIKFRNTQRALSRSKVNSKNHQKALKKLQKVQNRINNIRQDVTHKFTSTVAKNHGIVVVEDLDIQEMTDQAKFRAMRRSLHHSLMGTIIQQLSYKVHTLKKVDRFYPSSKLCSRCGHKKSELSLNERTYKCEHCGAVIDRDLNAAINLCKAGEGIPGVPVEAESYFITNLSQKQEDTVQVSYQNDGVTLKCL